MAFAVVISLHVLGQKKSTRIDPSFGVDRNWSLLFVRHGVTGVRLVGDIDGSGFSLRVRIVTGKIVGPDIATAVQY